MTKFRYQGHFLSRASVLVNQQGLIGVVDRLIVASLVVVGVAGLRTILVEGGGGALRKVNSVNFVGLLIVPSDHGSARQRFLNGLLTVAATLLSLVS